MKKPEDIKVKLILTDGYEQRFTEACLKQLRRREEIAALNEKAKTVVAESKPELLFG